MFDLIDNAADWLHASFTAPLMYHLGLMAYEEIAYNWSIFVTYGAASVLLAMLVCWPLEKLFPLQHWPDQRYIRVDMLYTVLARVGVLPLVTFVIFYQLQVWLGGWLADHGWVTPTLEDFFPVLLRWQILSFVVYLLIFDLMEYWRHRLSHRFRWWYALHAVHHAQRRMTFWSDDRNHVLDNTIDYLWTLGLGLILGVQPSEFPLIVLALSLLGSLSHINARVDFGPLRYILVSPTYHRAHHGLLAAGQNSCNYGVIFSFWDIIFRTADFRRRAIETGDGDAAEPYATGNILAQQWVGLRGIVRA